MAYVTLRRQYIRFHETHPPTWHSLVGNKSHSALVCLTLSEFQMSKLHTALATEVYSAIQPEISSRQGSTLPYGATEFLPPEAVHLE